ncbi:MAG: nucleoside deaminase [Pirellulaceae bacterium]
MIDHPRPRDEADFDLQPDHHFMRLALQQAVAAFEQDEVPVGAVIVHEGRVIGAAHNQRETLSDPTAHAEMLAITQAAEARSDWRLNGCTLYVTLEPCPMCGGFGEFSHRPSRVWGSRPKGRSGPLTLHHWVRPTAQSSFRDYTGRHAGGLWRDPDRVLPHQAARWARSSAGVDSDRSVLETRSVWAKSGSSRPTDDAERHGLQSVR